MGVPLPATGPAPVGPVYDNPNIPEYAWPTYAQYPNYAAVTYPSQYSASAWPYIGPFYPYPQVPLNWRKVQLEWSDGHWDLEVRLADRSLVVVHEPGQLVSRPTGRSHKGVFEARTSKALALLSDRLLGDRLWGDWLLGPVDVRSWSLLPAPETSATSRFFLKSGKFAKVHAACHSITKRQPPEPKASVRLHKLICQDSVSQESVRPETDRRKYPRRLRVTRKGSECHTSENMRSGSP